MLVDKTLFGEECNKIGMMTARACMRCLLDGKGVEGSEQVFCVRACECLCGAGGRGWCSKMFYMP